MRELRKRPLPKVRDAIELLEFYGWQPSLWSRPRGSDHEVEASHDASRFAPEQGTRRETPTQASGPGEPDSEGATPTRRYPVVVQRSPGRFGAYAPEIPGSFILEPTIADALRRVRETIATSLRLVGEMGDELPEPRPEVARALARVTDPNAGLPNDPSVQVITVEVGPGDMPPDAPSSEPSAPATTQAPWRETFAAVFAKTRHNYSGEAPDLEACVSTGDTIEEIRWNMAEAISRRVQSMVDDGDPLPERRLTPAEALARRTGGSPAEATDPDGTETAELVTVKVHPPRPQVRLLNDIWRQACRNRSAFHQDRAVLSPVAAGETWSGAYAADLLYAEGVWYGRIAEWEEAVETGATREELRRNLQAAIARALLESISDGGTIPLPRRTKESAAAERNLLRAGDGDDEFVVPDEAVEMIPVRITAPTAPSRELTTAAQQ